MAGFFDPMKESISSFGQMINAPVLFDWDTAAARQDARTGAVRNGEVKRSVSSVAGRSAINQTATMPKVLGGFRIQTPGAVGAPGIVGGAPLDENGIATGANTANGSFTSDPTVLAQRQALARVQKLRGDIKGRAPELEAAFNALFGDMDNLARDKSAEIERKAGENINDLTGQYTASIPGIESSYAALGAGDSTDTRDAKISAKTGYEKSVKQVGDNKDADLAKVGQYANESKAKWSADKDSMLRLISRVDETENEGDLNTARNEVENKLGTLNADRATLTTDAGARGKLSEITKDGGRYEAAKAALDNVLKSSLSGGVKQAAVEAISNSADLDDEDKQRIKLEYGNVYDTPDQV